MKLIFDQRKATVTVNKSGNQFGVLAKEQHVYLVIENLLDNALKYSVDRPEINVDIEGRGKYVTLKIQDNGQGIPKEYQSKIFEKFFRVPTGDLHGVKGYGLGLSYVKNIVSLLGGSINVHSVPNAGTTFTIQLPAIETNA